MAFKRLLLASANSLKFYDAVQQRHNPRIMALWRIKCVYAYYCHRRSSSWLSSCIWWLSCQLYARRKNRPINMILGNNSHMCCRVGRAVPYITTYLYPVASTVWLSKNGFFPMIIFNNLFVTILRTSKTRWAGMVHIFFWGACLTPVKNACYSKQGVQRVCDVWWWCVFEVCPSCNEMETSVSIWAFKSHIEIRAKSPLCLWLKKMVLVPK